MNFLLNIAQRAGYKTITLWRGFAEFTAYNIAIARSLKSTPRQHFRSIYNIIVNQVYFTGLNSMPFVIVVALIIGATVIVQSFSSLPKFGIEEFLGNLMVIIIVREAGPLITALIVISRSGSAIASEVAAQKQNGEIRAFEIMGINTKIYITFPRIIAFLLALLSLIIIFNVTAFIGGYLISTFTHYIPLGEFVTALIDSLTIKDLASMLIKSVIFGVSIPVICCYHGLKPKSPFEVPIFVSKAVSQTLFSIIIINAAISLLFYL
ncbi:MAG: ABC transporter permease [Leptospirales bacterium]|nr:ABC transporter permease [Leptospirales bacterium]